MKPAKTPWTGRRTPPGGRAPADGGTPAPREGLPFARSASARRASPARCGAPSRRERRRRGGAATRPSPRVPPFAGPPRRGRDAARRGARLPPSRARIPTLRTNSDGRHSAFRGPLRGRILSMSRSATTSATRRPGGSRGRPLDDPAPRAPPPPRPLSPAPSSPQRARPPARRAGGPVAPPGSAACFLFPLPCSLLTVLLGLGVGLGARGWGDCILTISRVSVWCVFHA